MLETALLDSSAYDKSVELDCYTVVLCCPHCGRETTATGCVPKLARLRTKLILKHSIEKTANY